MSACLAHPPTCIPYSLTPAAFIVVATRTIAFTNETFFSLSSDSHERHSADRGPGTESILPPVISGPVTPQLGSHGSHAFRPLPNVQMQTRLHQVCRHVPVVRPFAVLFSTSARRGNDSGDFMSHLSNMLGGVNYQRPQSAQQQYKTTPRVKIQPHRVLRPTELSYNSRVKTHKPFAKYQVAPPPSIARGNDVFYRLNLDPRSFTMNPEVLYQFVSGMGKIYPREQTMLTAKSQRLLAKTIRRAKQMGVMANLSRPRSSF